MGEQAKVKGIVKWEGLTAYVRHDRLMFRISWEVPTTQYPSHDQPVLLRRSVAYSTQAPHKQIYIYRYPAGTERLGSAVADAREVL